MATTAATEWCDRHHGYVDEGRTRPMATGSRYRICDACQEEPGIASVGVGTIDQALVVLVQPGLTIEDRAAAYGLLHQVQLRVNRALRPVRDELIAHLRGLGRDASIGPLRLKSTAVGVAWPCNDPGNWQDVGLQDAMEGLRQDPDTRPYIRHVPEHYEIDTVALGGDVAAGIAQAHRLHREMKLKGWRTEETRRWSLDVREVRP